MAATDDVRGIGIDEQTAVLLDTDGAATVEGFGAAWFLRMRADDVVSCAPSRPLETRAIEAVATRAGATFDTASWTGDGVAFAVEVANASVQLETRRAR